MMMGDNVLSIMCEPHRRCYGYRARFECGRSWVRAQVGSNQRLWKWYLLLFRYARCIFIH